MTQDLVNLVQGELLIRTRTEQKVESDLCVLRFGRMVLLANPMKQNPLGG